MQISLRERFLAYCFRMLWRMAAIVALLFFPSFWDLKSVLASFLIFLAASSLYGKFGRLS